MSGIQQTEHAVDTAGIESFLFGHWRQNSGKTFRKHGFPGSRRTDEQDIVTACRRNLQCALGKILSFDIGKIRDLRPVRLGKTACMIRLKRRQPALNRRCGFLKTGHSEDADRIGGDRRFRQISGGDDQSLDLRCELPREECNGEDALHSADGAVESEFSEDHR